MQPIQYFWDTLSTIGIPLFQLYSFLTRLSPLTLKGPCSRKAPPPIDEQPGPTKREEWQVRIHTTHSQFCISNSEIVWALEHLGNEKKLKDLRVLSVILKVNLIYLQLARAQAALKLPVLQLQQSSRKELSVAFHQRWCIRQIVGNWLVVALANLWFYQLWEKLPLAEICVPKIHIILCPWQSIAERSWLSEMKKSVRTRAL